MTEERSARPPPAPASPAERDRTAVLLSRHFARDHLDVEELERRLDRAYAARSADELRGLTSDLPELPREAAPEAAPEPASVAVAGPTVEAGVEMTEREVLVGIMGGTERKGAWTPPRHTIAVVVMGGAGLDFREARLGAKEVRVTVLAIMGGVEILVPPGMRVEVAGSALMGAFEHRADGLSPGAGAPVLRIDGLALMGGVEVKVRLPGESEREARARRKAERRRMKGEETRLLRG